MFNSGKYLICSSNYTFDQRYDFATPFYFIAQEVLCFRQGNDKSRGGCKTRNHRVADETYEPSKPMDELK